MYQLAHVSLVLCSFFANVALLLQTNTDPLATLFQVDFLDTAGDLQFPAMRRLSITNAQAFVLVYSVNDANSFDIVKSIFEEIREIRSDFQVKGALFLLPLYLFTLTLCRTFNPTRKAEVTYPVAVEMIAITKSIDSLLVLLWMFYSYTRTASDPLGSHREH